MLLLIIRLVQSHYLIVELKNLAKLNSNDRAFPFNMVVPNHKISKDKCNYITLVAPSLFEVMSMLTVFEHSPTSVVLDISLFGI